MKKQHYLLFLLSLVFSFTSYTQSISEAHFEQKGAVIVVYYTIIDAQAKQVFDISLYYTTNNGKTWQGPLKEVSDNVGKVQLDSSSFTGKITWNVLEEVEKLQATVQFEVQANLLDHTAIPQFFDMVSVEGNTFKMGDDQWSCTQPRHKVSLSSFYICKYEVTQKQWREVMGENPSYYSDCDDCPVEQVSWNDIQVFLKKVNAKTGQAYRLPTEAEWEFAARGGRANTILYFADTEWDIKYAGSRNIDEVAWYSGNSNNRTHKVGQKKPNELGLYDMSGNVWEWCSDWFDENYYSTKEHKNPTGAATGKRRSLRGGSWNLGNAHCRVAFRSSDRPDARFSSYGFRVALSY